RSAALGISAAGSKDGDAGSLAPCQAHKFRPDDRVVGALGSPHKEKSAFGRFDAGQAAFRAADLRQAEKEAEQPGGISAGKRQGRERHSMAPEAQETHTVAHCIATACKKSLRERERR